MMDFQELSAMQYRLLRESLSEGFKQLRQVNAKNAFENAQRFARLEEMIRNLQPPQSGVGGSSESSDEKPGGRR